VSGKDKKNIETAMRSPTKRQRQESNSCSRKKKKSTRTCKWCGATSHKTKRSKKCPFFGKNDAQLATTVAAVVDDNSNEQSPIPVATTTAVVGDNSNEQSPIPVATTTAVATATSDEPAVTSDEPDVTVGSNVLGMWSRNKWFLAHVTKIDHRGHVDLYFPDDGKVKLGLHPRKIKSCPLSKDGIPVHKRGDLIKKVFYDDGECDNGVRIPDGMWLVRRIDGNEYVCVRSPDCRNKNANPNMLNFDIGHVIRQVTDSEQRNRNSF
jgi:hypothetical protein